MVEFFRRRETSDEIRERQQEGVVAELDNPEMEEMSTRLFEGSVRSVQLRMDMDGVEDGEREYARLQEQEKQLLAEHGKDIFLYATRKFFRYCERKLWWTPIHHWEHFFLKSEYLGVFTGELDEKERRFVFGHISQRLRKNLKEIRKARYPETVSAVEKDKANVEALRSFLPRRDLRKSAKLIDGASRALAA